MKTLLCLSLTLLPLKADGLSDLRAALQRLKGREGVAGQVDLQRWSLEKGKGKTPRQGQALVRLEDGPQGLKVGWSQAQLERAEVRKRKNGEEKGPDSSSEVLRSMGLDEAQKVLRASDHLLDQLEGATLKSESVEAWEGRSARKLVLDLVMDMDKEEREAIKESANVATVWIGADSAPLAMETKMDMKGRIFLISFEMHQTANRRYQVKGNRLLLVQEDRMEKGSGMGKGQETRTVLKLTPDGR